MRDIKKKVCFCGLGSIGKGILKICRLLPGSKEFFETHALRKTDKVLEERKEKDIYLGKYLMRTSLIIITILYL